MSETKRIERFALIAFFAAFVAALLLVRAASANEERRPCRDEIRKLCGDVERGSGALRDCVKEHESELSAECRQRIDEFRQHREQARAACRDDVKSLCGEVEPGRGNVMQCLQEHKSELSEDCRQNLAQRPHWRGHHRSESRPQSEHGDETP